MATPHERFLDALEGRGCRPRQQGEAWAARCPAHDDHKPSLSVSEGQDGQVLVKCFAGCTVADVCAALGMKICDLFPSAVAAPTVATLDSARKDLPKRAYKTSGALSHAISRRLGGKLAGTWVYRNADGPECLRVLRFNLPDGGKEYRPIHLTPKGWVVGDPPGLLPIYGLPLKSTVARIYVVEGEKCVEALRDIGLAATTSAHGAKSASKTYWTPLAGLEAVILPDNDAAGRGYAHDVAAILSRLNPPATVRMVDLPDLAGGGDVVDWMDELDAKEPDELREALEEMADRASVYEPDVELPVDAHCPFPVQVLPDPVRAYVIQGAEALGCDPSYIALPMLSALSASIGNTRRVELKGNWQEPSVLWTAIVGESGVLKSPALDLALAPLREREADAMGRYADARQTYEADALRYEAELKEWKANGHAQGEDPPTKPSEPRPDRYICSDTTIEALAMRLDDNPRGLLNTRDELAGWVKSFDAYRKGHGGDAEHWLSMHGAKPLTFDRKTSRKPVVYIPRAAVSVTGTIQPGALQRCLGEKYVENGFAGRILFAMPPAKRRRWSEAEIARRVAADVGAVFDHLLSLEFGADASGRPAPVDLPLSSNAKAEWIEYVNAHGEVTAAATGSPLGAALAKLEGGAARLALVVHMIRVATGEANDGEVDAASIEAGITLARWFADEARRIYAMLYETKEQREERRLIEHIRAKGGRVTARDLMRGGPRCSRSAEAERLLDGLADAGMGSWETRDPGPKGGRPTNVFTLRRSTDTDTTLDSRSSSGA